MENLNQRIETLRKESEKLVAEKNKDLIEYFNDVYGVGFGEERDFNGVDELYNEDGEGYLDPFDLAMDENDILQFLKWRYRLYLISKTDSLAECLERISDGKEHVSKKHLEKEVSDMRGYKRLIEEILSVSKDTLEKIEEIMKVADKYRG